MTSDNFSKTNYWYIAAILIFFIIIMIGSRVFDTIQMKVDNKTNLQDKCEYDCNAKALSYYAIVYMDNNTLCQCVPFEKNVTVIWEDRS